MMNDLINILKEPPKEYRAVPFWSWNDKLDAEILRCQVREMDKAGLGGYFMHARGGLQTKYMGDDWMECIKACIEEGNKTGMSSWCYDEDGWPSGFAGGLITAMGDKYHIRWLEFEETIHNTFIDDEQVLGLYKLDNATNKLTYLSKAELDSSENSGDKIIIIRHNSHPYYIDILNKEVVKAFIESTHEKYYNLFKEHFGKGMPGFFTDEPQIKIGEMPWSYILPEEFIKRKGYDLIKVLPALYIECEGFEKVRYDFWDVVSELFVVSFGEQIYNWCEEHDCKLTGHAMMEDSLYMQMASSGGCMPLYEYMHVPGMDWLSRHISSPVTPKQVGSVANQLGKKFVLSETFALCGWDVSLEELKWIAEWQYVNGINLMCQHLEGYTLKGATKRDHPPSLFYQQSWWNEYKQFNDHFARLAAILTSGRNVAEVLLLHPIKSGWIAYNQTNNADIQKLNHDFERASELLSDLHIDHHYGDETIIRKHGKVEGQKFIVGQCEYKAVIMPSMLTLDETTIKLLHSFIENGGKVISIGEFPGFCGGVNSENINLLKKKVHIIGVDKKVLYDFLRDMDIVSIRISDRNSDAGKIHYQQRDLGKCQVYFLVNHDQKQTYHTVVTVKGRGQLRLFSLDSGEFEDIEYWHDGDSTSTELQFLPMQSYVLWLDKEECNKEKILVLKEKESIIKPAGEWNIEEMDLNSLTLDYCSYRINDGKWEGPVPTIKLIDILLGHRQNCDIALKFTFEVDMQLERNHEFFLAVETADEFMISVNGNKVEYRDSGWWKDRSFKKVDIKPFVKKGINEIVLKRKFHLSQKAIDVLTGDRIALETEVNKLTIDTELESIYVVGDFGVVSKSGYSYGDRKAVFTDSPFVITDRPMTLRSGDLTEQDLCFFAGSIKLSQEITIHKEEGTKVVLDFGKPNAAMMKLYVNDTHVRTILWSPFSADISDFTVEGTNKITVELFAGNRNLLGPHHNIDGELYSVHPTSFTEKGVWEEQKHRYIWTDRYCFVKFGF